MSGYDEIDEKYYADVSFGVLLVSEVFGVEAFRYDSEQARDAGLRALCSSIEELDDEVDRDVAMVTDGEIRHIGTWDGAEWEALDLPAMSPSV